MEFGTRCKPQSNSNISAYRQGQLAIKIFFKDLCKLSSKKRKQWSIFNRGAVHPINILQFLFLDCGLYGAKASRFQLSIYVFFGLIC
jgi:hypothetical protein